MEILVPGLLIIAILIILFLLLREVVMWYWKINERIKLQKETNVLLSKLLSKNDYSSINKDSNR